MKCSFCKKELEESDLYCPNCGKKVVKKKNYKPLIIVGCFYLVIITLFVMMFTTMFRSFNTFKPTISNEKAFLQKAESVGCEIIDVLETTPNNGLEYYYVTNQETCPYLMAYAKFKDEKLMNNFFRNLLSETNKVDGAMRNEYNVTITHYIERTIIGSEYKSASLGDKTVLYIQTDKENKDTATSIKESLGFKYEMDWTFMYYGIASFGTELLLMMIAIWKLFKKMGHHGWESLIPIYNLVLLCKDVMGKKRYAFLFFIPLVNMIFLLVLSFNIAKVFGKNDGFQVLAVFFSSFMIPLIAFDDSKYTKPSEIKKLEELNNISKDQNSNINERKGEKVAPISAVNHLGNERNAINETEEKKSVWKIFLNIIKWILTIFMLLISLAGVDYENFLIRDIVICAFFFIFAVMICPLITKYTKKFKWYTANKGWIVLILIVLMFVLVAILP